MEQTYKTLLTALMACIALMQFVQVITRYIFEIPVMGLEELMVIPTVWMYMMGAANASREDSQIRANVLELFIKTERGRLRLSLVSETISFIVSAWLTYWAWDYVKYAWRVWKESSTLYIPTFYYECSVFIGLVLVTIYIGYHISKIIASLRNPALAIAKG